MYCAKCGRKSDDNSSFCVSCGQLLTRLPREEPSARSGASFSTVEQGRGSTILLFGILSVILAGLLLGIPAWVMGRRDLKKIDRGAMTAADMPATRAGMILGIIGTFLNPVLWLLALVLLVGAVIFH